MEIGANGSLTPGMLNTLYRRGWQPLHAGYDGV